MSACDKPAATSTMPCCTATKREMTLALRAANRHCSFFRKLHVFRPGADLSEERSATSRREIEFAGLAEPRLPLCPSTFAERLALSRWWLRVTMVDG